MTKEIEILSEIAEKDFYDKIEEFTSKFGEPKKQKRLGIVFSSYEKDNYVDTRLKITDGQIHLIQKLGDGLAAMRTNTENNIDLDLNTDQLISLIKVFQNLGTLIDNFLSPLQQYKNYIFNVDNIEVKFYEQFNSENCFYGFEIEVTNGEQKDIYSFAEKNGLQIDNINRDMNYWMKYDKKYNTDSLKLRDEELLKILNKYLD